MANSKSIQSNKINLMAFVGMTCALVVSIRNVPSVAAAGWTMFFYLIVATLLYAFPISLISGEFAGMFPKDGGPELWTTNSLGQKWGFVSAWLLWVQMFPGMVMVSSVLAPLFGNIIGNENLGQNNFITLMFILVVYWAVTILNMHFDMAKFGGNIGVWLGVYIPIAIMFIMGLLTLFKVGIDPKSTLGTFSVEKLIPDKATSGTLQYFATVIFIFTGIEMSSVYITRLVNPIKTYIRGIFIALIFLFLFDALNAFVVANVVPAGEMELSNISQSIVLYCQILGWPPVIANIFSALVFIGVIVQLSAWVSGPSKTITQSARRGMFPPKLNYWKTNEYGVSKAVIFTQASVISIFALVYLLVPSVNSAFLMLVNATTIIYSLVYVLLGIGIIRLRRTHPDYERPFRIGKKGNSLIYVLVIAFFITMVMAVVFTFWTSKASSIIIVALITLVLFLLPLGINKIKKASWKDDVTRLMEEEAHNIPDESLIEVHKRSKKG